MEAVQHHVCRVSGLAVSKLGPDVPDDDEQRGEELGVIEVGIARPRGRGDLAGGPSGGLVGRRTCVGEGFRHVSESFILYVTIVHVEAWRL